MIRNDHETNGGIVRRLKDNALAKIATVVLAALCSLPGCTSPVWYTDNEMLLYLPGAGRRSDKLPGYVPPRERFKLIEEKGKKGVKAPPEEKDILLVQLVQEYENTNSPHIRRCSLDAIARISSNYANPAAEKIFRSALEDPDRNLNLSAAHALAIYANQGAIAKDNKKERKLAIELLASRYRSLPYLINAGSEEENADRKDVRIAILHALGEFNEDDSAELFDILEEALVGEKLDDGALEATACSSLEKITGKQYGVDGEKWLQYISYKRGDGDKPKEENILDRAPKLENATGIFK